MLHSNRSPIQVPFNSFSLIYFKLRWWSVHHMWAWCPWRSEEGVGGPGTGVMKSCGLPHGCWKPGSSARRANALNSCAHLQPIVSVLYDCCGVFPRHRTQVSPMQYVECMPGNGIARPRDLQTFSIIVSQQIVRVKVMPWSGFQVTCSLRP